MATTVTIEKGYVDTLLRRAELHDSCSAAEGLGNITVPIPYYYDLVRCSREYHILRQALVKGGISLATLDLLIQSDDPYINGNTYNEASHKDQDWWSQPTSKPVRLGLDADEPTHIWHLPIRGDNDGKFRSNGHADHLHTVSHGINPFPSTADDTGFLELMSEPGLVRDEPQSLLGSIPDEIESQSWTELQPRKGPRTDHTVLLSNLPDGSTHKDVASVVKGGRLVDIWLRKRERAAQVTFVEGASDFLNHARRNEIRIGGRRVEVTWSDRQVTVDNYLINKVKAGMSRNFVIRGANPKLTEETIRLDVEHIHNLVIISFVWKGVDAYISTNSINHAMFARTCMLSRLLYKGLKIEWYPDECAERLPKANQAAKVKPCATPQQTKVPTAMNRFTLLDLNDSDSASVQLSSDDETHMSGVKLSPRSNATSSTIG